MEGVETVVIAAAVLAGAMTQRLTGIGFALVAAPFLVLVIGPLQGVAVTNALSVVVALSGLIFNFRNVEYRRVLPLLVAAGIAVVPGAILARSLPSQVLAIGAGVLVVLALMLSLVARRLRGIAGWPGLVGGGMLSGFMSVIAGVGGPAVTAYAIASSWEHRRFAVSVQFYFLVLSSMSLLARGVVPALSMPDLIAATVALVAGLLVGRGLVRWIPLRVARAACFTVALLGGIAVIVRGIAA